MHSSITFLAFARQLALGALLGLVVVAQPASGETPAAVIPPYSTVFDAARDPQADLALALHNATDSGRRVLVMVGGDWCVWCFLLDRHLGMDAEARRALYAGFEVLRVYYGDDNTNQAFLANFPEFHLFPHFFVLEADGRVLASVDADLIIADAKYDTGLIREFVANWGKAPG